MPPSAVPVFVALATGGLVATLLLSGGAPLPVPCAEQPPVLAATQAVTGLPTDSRMVLRLHDHARALTRWQASPYPALARTAWGAGVLAEAGKQPGFFQLIALLADGERSELGVAVRDGHPQGTLRIAHPGALFADVMAGRQVTPTVNGDLSTAALPLDSFRLDSTPWDNGIGVTRFRWDDLLALPAAVIATPAAPTADAEEAWKVALPGTADAVGAVREQTLQLAAEWTVEPFGLRERVRLAGLPVPAAPLAAASAAERDGLARLPTDTLWAVALAMPTALTALMPGFDERALTAWAARQQLPLDAERLKSIGRTLAWSSQGVPLPAISLTIEMPADTGAMVLAWLDAQYQFSPGTDGVHLGVIGFIPVQAGWRDGRLVATTLPTGIAGALARPGGFADQPGIGKALKELPAGDLLIAGASRSGASWGAIASFAPWLARRKPELATMGADLTAAGRYGFLAARRDGADVRMDAGGLFGGPLAANEIIGGFFRLTAQGGRPGPRNRPADRVDQPAPAEKPKPVEF